MQSLYPSPQGSDGFPITPSDTLDIVEDVANYDRVESVYLHNPSTAGTIRVMPAGKRAPTGFTLTGTSGTANITVNGVAYLVTFSSALATTAANFVATHKKALKALNLDVVNQSGTAVLIFKGATHGNLSIANATGDLSGTALTATPITIYMNQGDSFPMPIKRIYASTPTPPTGLIGMYGGSR